MKNIDKKLLILNIIIIFILLIFSALLYGLGHNVINKNYYRVTPSYIPFNSTDIVVTKVEV